MATYKQRTPYQRQLHSGRDSPDLDVPRAAGSTTAYHHQQSSAYFNSQNSHLHNSAAVQTEDTVLDNTSDQEWTSIRPAASARAKARQQLFLSQEQQRAQEWSFVLGQHRQQRPTAPVSLTATTVALSGNAEESHSDRIAATAPTETIQSQSSDELDEVRSNGDVTSVLTSPRAYHFDDNGAVPRLRRLDRINSADHSVSLGFSDVTSDGLEGLDESEDLSIWSQDDDDALSTSTTPLSRPRSWRSSRNMYSRSPYSPSAVSYSSSTSLSNLVHPSFAQAVSGAGAGAEAGAVEAKIQNRMPLHDGSGNFIALSPGSLQSGSDQESDLGWDSASSVVSSTFRTHLSRDSTSRRPKRWSSTARGTISPSEFDTVIHNIALFQGHHASKSKGGMNNFGSHGQSSAYRPPLPSTTLSILTRKPAVQSKLQNCSIYESEMEDIDAMVIDIPSKLGWMQVFEQALRAFNTNDTALEIYDSTVMSPIKALAQTNPSEDVDLVGLSRTLAPEVPQAVKSRTTRPSRRTSVSNSSSSSSVASTTKSTPQIKTLKQQVSGTSLGALQQLQKRHRANYQQPRCTSRPMESLTPRDPMQVNFSPTVGASPWITSSATSSQKSSPSPPSSSKATMTGLGQDSSKDSNVLVAMLSTLRRFRDHVKSNLMHPEFGDEISYGSGSYFSGDLGIEWATGYGSLPSVILSHQSPSSPALGPSGTADSNSSDGHQRRNHQRAVSGSSWATFSGSGGSSRSSQAASSAVRRIGSDCRLESLRHERVRAHGQQRLVE
ncbi:hypothetical protein EMPS_11249 [Entomortierella parvispora]|uniref:Uncharacterized protein n=1 Tax=Entomortierella parvispora TaxID=205924 RepID=A0A9P3HLQ3_9FUNG|nr:hypothetical protein EMPS_11249 [Entomortierella parvispora]